MSICKIAIIIQLLLHYIHNIACDIFTVLQKYYSYVYSSNPCNQCYRLQESYIHFHDALYHAWSRHDGLLLLDQPDDSWADRNYIALFYK